MDDFETIEVDLGETNLGGAALFLELEQLDVGDGVDVVGARLLHCGGVRGLLS